MTNLKLQIALILAFAPFATIANAQGMKTGTSTVRAPSIGRPGGGWQGGKQPGGVSGTGNLRTYTVTGVVNPNWSQYGCDYRGGYRGGYGGRYDCHYPYRGCFGYRNYLYIPYGIGGYYSNDYFGSSIYPASYDPFYSNLRLENDNLRRQIDALARANPPAPANPAVKVDVPLRNAPLAKDRNLQAEEKSQKLMVEGTKNFLTGKYSVATEKYRQASKLVLDDASPHFLLAQSLFASKKYNEAVKAIKEGLRVNPEWLEAEFDVASLYEDPERLTLQMSELAKIIKANPLDKNAHFLLGFELFATGEHEKARTILEHAARLEPDDAHIKPFFDFYSKKFAAAVP